MLTKVTAYNLSGVESLDPLVIPLRLEDRYLFDQVSSIPSMDIIQITNIDGLGPVKANVNTSPYGSMDGAAYNGSNVADRNIVATITLNPDWDIWTPSKLRKLVYSYFIPKSNVRLVFESDADYPPVEIFGYVETCEPNIFSKDLEIQISIICPNPYFQAVNYVVEAGQTGDAPINIVNDGTVDSGINVVLTKSSGADPTLFKIQVRDVADEHFWVDAGLTTGVRFEMNSVPGQKYIRNVNIGTGDITNLLYTKEEGSTWPLLKPGVNAFFIQNTPSGSVNDWVLNYYPRFGGL